MVCSALGLARVLAACSNDSGSGQDASIDNVVGCATNLTMCKGACVDLTADPANCGGCGSACKSGELCTAGKCSLTCSGGSFQCDSGCTDLLGDTNNCGGCGVKCAAGQVCNDGGCALSCQQGFNACPGDGGTLFCTDPQSNDLNCGKCGTACGAGTRCQAGTCSTTCQDGLSICTIQDSDGGSTDHCTDLTVDPNNCGGCGNVCEGGTFCSPTDDAGDAACGLGCFGGSILCGSRCVDPKIDPFNCGGCNKACDGGAKCVNSTCQ